MRTGSSSTGKDVMWSTPLRPLSMASRVVGASNPRGVIAPIPVTTTRRRRALGSSDAMTHVLLAMLCPTTRRREVTRDLRFGERRVRGVDHDVEHRRSAAVHVFPCRTPCRHQYGEGALECLIHHGDLGPLRTYSLFPREGDPRDRRHHLFRL